LTFHKVGKGVKEKRNTVIIARRKRQRDRELSDGEERGGWRVERQGYDKVQQGIKNRLEVIGNDTVLVKKQTDLGGKREVEKLLGAQNRVAAAFEVERVTEADELPTVGGLNGPIG